MSSVSDEVLDTVATGSYYAPHDILGPHQEPDGSWVIRARRPMAKTVTAITDDGVEIPLAHVRGGVWEGAAAAQPQAYELVATYDGAPDYRVDDPYRHLPTIGDVDQYLIGEGRHEELWRVLGAHVRHYSGVSGVSFSVWAPHARAVRVVGGFNSWDGQGHALRSLGSSGVWELFVPGLHAGTTYKFEILTPHSGWILKADPMAHGRRCRRRRHPSSPRAATRGPMRRG